MFGPILRGKQVTLRPPTKEEIPVYPRWFADMEVTRYLGRRTPPSLEEEEEFFKKMAEDRDNVFWAIEVEGKMVGSVGIHGIDWVNQHAITGIVIGEKDFWRRGIATEAMALRTAYAFRELNLHKLKTRAFMENEGSKRALQKAGYKQSGVECEEMYREGGWHDMWVGELLRSEWERQAGT